MYNENTGLIVACYCYIIPIALRISSCIIFCVNWDYMTAQYDCVITVSMITLTYETNHVKSNIPLASIKL